MGSFSAEDVFVCMFDVFVLLPSVYPQRSGSQKRPCDGGQRYEDRRLRSRQRCAQYRLLQKDHKREKEMICFNLHEGMMLTMQDYFLQLFNSVSKLGCLTVTVDQK